MAMDGNQLGKEITAAIIHSGAPPEVQAEVLKLWQKIGTAIVSHIVTNAVIPAGIPVKTEGTAVSQAGQTTGTGKVT